MSTFSLQQVESLFDRLVALPADAREQALQQCPEPPALVAQVRALLAADTVADEALASMVAEAAADVVSATSPAPMSAPTSLAAGSLAGEWRLLRVLGQGGMGTVFLAARDGDTSDTRVAVKLLHTPHVAQELHTRFRRERRILERLQHPLIARLLESGATSDGTPYLVMDYVNGVALDVWCAEQQLSVARRVALLHAICDVVQHAHEAFVVHRDLKPENILVTRDGAPVLLDFGIAKLLDPDNTAQTEPSRLQAMTFAYASPEQLWGEQVTHQSDIWSLGVIAYRLLTQHPPYDIARCAPLEVARRVSAGPPPPPSTRVPDALAPLLRGDLDAILLQALQPEPSRRYRSAAELGADFARWLGGDPVSAPRVTGATAR
jgi:eukaryotic-like serine/threonine-protein kinase